MHIIVGLGNPTAKYSRTRHNVGFMFIDYLAKQTNIKVRELKHKAQIGSGVIDGEKVILVKPQTYMNLSGEAVREILDYYKLGIESLIVVYDDVALPVGKLRIRPKGSAGGHNGIKNIIQHTGSESFKRIRIGVGSADADELIEHVLGKFGKEDKKLIDKAIDTAADAVKLLIKDACDEAMNKYNG